MTEPIDTHKLGVDILGVYGLDCFRLAQLAAVAALEEARSGAYSGDVIRSCEEAHRLLRAAHSVANESRA